MPVCTFVIKYIIMIAVRDMDNALGILEACASPQG